MSSSGLCCHLNPWFLKCPPRHESLSQLPFPGALLVSGLCSSQMPSLPGKPMWLASYASIDFTGGELRSLQLSLLSLSLLSFVPDHISFIKCDLGPHSWFPPARLMGNCTARSLNCLSVCLGERRGKKNTTERFSKETCSLISSPYSEPFVSFV